MPTLDEALRFVRDSRTSLQQLQNACELLGIPAEGSVEALRARLLSHLGAHDPQQEVVCLNPRLA